MSCLSRERIIEGTASNHRCGSSPRRKEMDYFELPCAISKKQSLLDSIINSLIRLKKTIKQGLGR